MINFKLGLMDTGHDQSLLMLIEEKLEATYNYSAQ